LHGLKRIEEREGRKGRRDRGEGENCGGEVLPGSAPGLRENEMERKSLV